MIAFDFNYYKPSTIAEAIETYITATSLRKKLSIIQEEQNSLRSHGRIKCMPMW